ncbi:MAG: sulfide/dihydroorotate dehydrogenase-like FAD/NAD-binding protein [bacterium]
MTEIVSKDKIGPEIYKMEVSAPEVAESARPGQFVVLRLEEKGERFPLTIVDFDKNSGLVTLVVQAVGESTRKLAKMNRGEEILDFLGPLGEPTEVDEFGHVACVAGGLGAALVYPVASAYKEANNKVTIFLGARSSDYLILEERLDKVSDELIVTTDDGSRGIEGFGTDALNQKLEAGEEYDRVFAAGPVPMMKTATDITRPYAIKTIVSLNPIMVDGTGMCGGCRVSVDGETKFACMDGPEFDGHLVNFEELMNRKQYFEREENCKLENI